MIPIPKKIRTKISDNPWMSTCIHGLFGGCGGRITWEHAYLYCGQRINDEFAIVPCCEKHNIGVYGQDKEWNRFMAVCRMKGVDIVRYPRKDWEQEFQRLYAMFVDRSDKIRLILDEDSYFKENKGFFIKYL